MENTASRFTSAFERLRRGEPVEVVRAAAHELSSLVGTLERAFAKDPMLGWLTRRDQRQTARRALFFETTLRSVALPHGEVYRTGGGQGVAVWFPPGLKVSTLTHLRHLPQYLRVAGLSRSWEVFSGIAALERKQPAEPHYYLMSLAVEPGHQGRGFGSALLRPVLDRCDREGLLACLETSNERNLPLYRRHGFELTETWSLPRGGPLQFLMQRTPGRGR